MLPEGRGVTYEVFAEPDPATQVPNPDATDDDEVEKEPVVKFTHVPDVVSEPNMHYFEIPRLGAYLAVPMIVKSYLSVLSFDDAITKLEAYEEQLLQAKEERVRTEKLYEEKIAKAKENEEDIDEIIKEYKEIKFPEVPFPEFEHDVKRYVLCTDTLGKDTDFKPEQVQTIVGHAVHFVKAWQDQELAYLQQDVKRFNEYIGSFENVADVIHDLAEKEEREAISKAAGFGELSEARINYKSDEVRLHVVKEQLLNKDLCLKHLLNLANYRIIKFPRVIQYAFYLAGYRKDDINEPGTNVLNWRKVRKHHFNEEFIHRLLAYSYAGPKNATVERYAGVNRINKRVKEIGNLF